MSDLIVVIVILVISIVAGYIGIFWTEIIKFFKRKPKFRVGDKVRIIRGYMKGHVGTINHIYSDGDYEVDYITCEPKEIELITYTSDEAFEALLRGEIDEEYYKSLIRRERGWRAVKRWARSHSTS